MWVMVSGTKTRVVVTMEHRIEAANPQFWRNA